MRKTTNKAWRWLTLGSVLRTILFALVLLAGDAGTADEMTGG